MDKIFHYRIKNNFAREFELPTSFVARVLKETEKALYLYGYGKMDPTGHCIACGRELTHPGSIILGIGPECLRNWSARDIAWDNVTEKDKRVLRAMARKQIIDRWVPKSRVTEYWEVEEVIEIPADHPMNPAKAKEKAKSESKRKALVIKGLDGLKNIKVVFPYNVADLEMVKGIPGRKFVTSGDQKYWTIPLTADNARILFTNGFSLSPKVKKHLDDLPFDISRIEPVEVPGLLNPDGKKMFEFQKIGVGAIEALEGRAILGDDMGLGKTLQIIGYLQLHRELRPAVVVCPASLKIDWEKEITAWMPNPNVQVLNGHNHKVPLTGDIIVVNYDILGNKLEKYKDSANRTRYREQGKTGWVDYILKRKPKITIIDEAHNIKTATTQKSKGTIKLGAKTEKCICVTGTLIVNRPIEMYNSLRLMKNNELPDWPTFTNRYCGAKHNGFGWDYTGHSNDMELHNILVSTVMIRRKKEEVLPQLPEKLRKVIRLPLTNWKEYMKAEMDYLKWLEDSQGEEAVNRVRENAQLTKYEALKQLANQGKIDSVLEWIGNALEYKDKLTVFAHHKFMISAIMEKFGDIAVKYDGSTSSINKDKAKTAFMTDPNIRLFVGNLQSAREGLTLTVASTMAIIELPWAPGYLDQVEDRIRRIGQKANGLNYYYLMGDKTIEDIIAEMLEEKWKVTSTVLDGDEDSRMGLTKEAQADLEQMSLVKALNQVYQKKLKEFSHMKNDFEKFKKERRPL